MIVNNKRISWIYLTEEGVRSIVAQRNIKTRCIIKKGDEIIAVGETICSKADNFVREIGRKVSLDRALINLFPAHSDIGINSMQKEKRKDIWNAFRTLTKKEKWAKIS